MARKVLLMSARTGGRYGRNAAAFALLVASVVATASILLADPASPIAVTKVDNPDPVASGSELTYTVTAVNTGGSKLTEVVMTDQVNGLGGIGVPPQLVLTSTRGSCTQSGNLVNCSAGTLEGGGSWVVTIRGIVTAANGTTLNNTASVSGTRSAQTFSSVATATTLVNNNTGSPLPDLSISKAGPTSVGVSQPMTYTLTVNNTGTANATGVRVVDTVPAGLTGPITASGTSLFVCGVAGLTVTCDGGAVNQGSNATITINATAPASPTTITNTASVDPDNTIGESDELNNTSALVDTQVTDTPSGAALTINKTDNPADIGGAGPDPVMPGALLTYKVQVTNTSMYRATDVVMVDGTQGLEAASIVVSQAITGGTEGTFGGCTVEAPQVRCLARTLNSGGTILYTITGRVVASAGSTIFNTATVTGNIRNEGVSNTDTELTTVKPGIDLTITKSDLPDPVCARSWPGAVPAPPVCRGGLTYTFVVGNSGVNAATGVLVRDPLPPGTHFDSFNAPAFAGGCGVDGANVLTCTNGTIGPESITTITIVLVAPPLIGPIVNTATVDPNNAIFEADETNNTATQGTQVVTGVDLTINKVDSAPGFDPIATSGTQTYTITVNNQGTQDATGIRVVDTLPSGTLFRDASGDNGFTCSYGGGIGEEGTGGVVTCVGGAVKGTASEFYPPFGAPGDDTATIRIRVFAQPFEGTMHNEVRVDPLNEIPEADETNNFEFEDTVVARGGGGSGAFNELTIVKTQLSPANPVARNAVVTYSIVVGNNATDPVTGVSVRDFLPAGARYIEAVDTTANMFLCHEFASYIQCDGGQIAAGGSATIRLRMFAPDVPGTYVNQAIVDPDNTKPEGNEFNNEDSETTVVTNGGNAPFNDLQIDKSGTATTTPGGTISYVVKVWNVGSDPALNVTVRDVLPEGTTFVSAEDAAPATPGAFTCSHNIFIVQCIGATIDGGTTMLIGARTINIVVTAPNDNVVLTNQAIVDPDNAIPEGNELNNTDTFDTTVQSVINLTITKSGPNVSSQSQTTDYTIKVKNNAPGGNAADGQTAIDVQMHDPLPVGLIPLAVEIDAGSENNWACQVSGNPINVVDCLGDLSPEQEVTIKITVFMTAESGRSLDNEACVDPADIIEEFAPGEADNCSTAISLVGPPPKTSPNFLLTKSVDPTSASPGDTLTYTITVSNVGSAIAKGAITVTDNLPDETTAVDMTGPNLWTCSAPADVMTCTNPAAPNDELGIGESITFTIHATVDPSASLPLVNVATVSPALADPSDSNAENETAANQTDNTATAKTLVGSAGFDLSVVVITDNPDPAAAGQPVKYTIVAVNGGSQNTTGVHVAVTLPSGGATYVGADGTNGFNCAAPVGTLVDCVGDLPAGGDTVITVTLNVILAPPGDLTLSAKIDPANAFNEDNEGNNEQSETTTVSGTVCVACIDLVSALLTASPEPVSPGGSVTFKYVLINTGDQPTSLSSGQVLAFFDFVVAGAGAGYTTFSLSSSNPAITCTEVGSGATFKFNNCTGNLGPGQGVTFTATMGGVTGTSVSASGVADPSNLVTEFSNSNNNLIETVVIQ